jgi:hypothetical protein
MGVALPHRPSKPPHVWRERAVYRSQVERLLRVSLRNRLAGGLFAAFAALLSYAPDAAAEPTASEKETARGHMSDGRDLRDQNDLTGALKRFQAADAIMQVPTTGLEVARTQVFMNLLIEARQTLHRVLQIPVQPGDPLPYREARLEAERLDQDLEARVGALRFDVRTTGSAEAPTIFVDGIQMREGAAALPLKVNPGPHQIVVKGASKELTQQVDALERQIVTVTIDLEQKAELPSDKVTIDGEVNGVSPWRTVSYVGFGVGVIGVGVGTVTGLLAISNKMSAKSSCVDDRCPPEAWSDLDRMNTYATVSTTSFVVGALGLTAAIGGLVLSGRDAGRGRSTARVGLSVVPSTRGLIVSGGF